MDFVSLKEIIFEGVADNLVARKIVSYLFVSFVKDFQTVNKKILNLKQILTEEELKYYNLSRMMYSQHVAHYDLQANGQAKPLKDGTRGLVIDLLIPKNVATKENYTEIQNKLYQVVRHEVVHLRQLKTLDKFPETKRTKKFDDVDPSTRKQILYLLRPEEVEAYCVEIVNTAKRKKLSVKENYDLTMNRIFSFTRLKEYPDYQTLIHEAYKNYIKKRWGIDLF